MNGVEEAIRLLAANGFEVGHLRVQQAHRTLGDYYKWHPLEGYHVRPEDESADLYFNSFEDADTPPEWSPDMLAIGRCFRLTRGQREILKQIVHMRVAPEAVIHDWSTYQGHIESITLRFPSISKLTKLHLGADDFRTFILESKRLDKAYEEAAALREEIESKKPKKRKMSNREKAIKELEALGLL
jgi:hypothetical protein